MTEGPHQPLMIEPGYPFQHGQLDRVRGFPGTTPMDQPRFVRAIDGVGQGVMVATTLAANRRCNSSFGKPLAVPDGDILRPPVARRHPGARRCRRSGLQFAVEFRLREKIACREQALVGVPQILVLALQCLVALRINRGHTRTPRHRPPLV